VISIVIVKIQNYKQNLMSFIQSHMPERRGFHMIGCLAEVLVEDPSYKTLVVEQLANSIFPEFSSCGYFQVRICWMLGCYNALFVHLLEIDDEDQAI
jgi:hypothetical protein